MCTAQNGKWPIYSLIGEQKSKHRTYSYEEILSKQNEREWIGSRQMKYEKVQKRMSGEREARCKIIHSWKCSGIK